MCKLAEVLRDNTTIQRSPIYNTFHIRLHSSCSRIEDLRLNNVRFDSFAAFVHVLRGFPDLRRLQCTRVEWYSDPVLAQFPEGCCSRLKDVSIGQMDARSTKRLVESLPSSVDTMEFFVVSGVHSEIDRYDNSFPRLADGSYLDTSFQQIMKLLESRLERLDCLRFIVEQDPQWRGCEHNIRELVLPTFPLESLKVSQEQFWVVLFCALLKGLKTLNIPDVPGPEFWPPVFVMHFVSRKKWDTGAES
ncbi:uncharacterized protein BXZ73DRAFT_76143 [Epithele typhae]|uniref:uncharacterized protein n=1 Tax=Epithele typhae TaxID=378194 RepID=UPI002008562C|nr:uncharacterized protein BXZ73DRAFT_76143 [Epithele typhae]KAH9938979.1 hypothetical protein BXZ73DRAFT_76143 [Epithele typhae]